MKQPEALRLAAAFEAQGFPSDHRVAAELRRLHEAEEHNRKYVATLEKEVIRLHQAKQDILAALKSVISEYEDGYGLKCVEQVKAAIAKGEQA